MAANLVIVLKCDWISLRIETSELSTRYSRTQSYKILLTCINLHILGTIQGVHIDPITHWKKPPLEIICRNAIPIRKLTFISLHMWWSVNG
ncbi:hypothetical protein FORC22_4781 (plasmid) [Vibrio parahaemolyticus]|nr:hypothetical protein FORC22_4781 [Vibrio parahaemolyticus]